MEPPNDSLFHSKEANDAVTLFATNENDGKQILGFGVVTCINTIAG